MQLIPGEPWLREAPFRFFHERRGRYRVTGLDPDNTLGWIQSTHAVACLGQFYIPHHPGFFSSMVAAAQELSRLAVPAAYREG